MLDCPKCRAPLPLFREAACKKCGADLSEAHATDHTEAPADPAAADRTRARRITLVMSISFCAILIITSLDSDVQSRVARAFGARPLGLPLVAFFAGSLTILFVPLPIVFYHFALVAAQARRDGFGFLGLGALLYLADVHRRQPQLTRSRRICLGGLGYYLVVVAAWIIYTVKLGI